MARRLGQASSRAGVTLNPDDYAPAADPGPTKPFRQGVTQGTSAGVPLYRDAAALPGVNIPNLRLDLHVFAAKPQERFVMINMHKLHEGDLMPEGDACRRHHARRGGCCLKPRREVSLSQD